jgi:hypothetical protein
MKPILAPTITAAIGFALAWTLKPTGHQAVGSVDSSENTSAQAKPSSRPSRPERGLRSAAEARPKEVDSTDFPLADAADAGPKERGEARLNRLTEALGLSIGQQGKIIAAVESARENVNPDAATLDDFNTRGKQIEAVLAETLSADQLAKFREMRDRERDNMIEVRAQRALGGSIEEIDVSPGQREELLSRLRQLEMKRYQQIPDAATLLLNSSILPTQESEIDIDGVLAIARLDEIKADPNDPVATHQAVLTSQRRELEERLACFDGILTPAQMGQLHAMIAEQKAVYDRLATQPRSDKKPVVPDFEESEVEPFDQ